MPRAQNADNDSVPQPALTPPATRSTPTQGASPAPVPASVLPSTGVVLIGTVGTLRSLWGQIESTFPGVIPSGCVLVEGGTPGAWSHGRIRDLPPVLGGLDLLIELHTRLRFKLALVSLPPGLDSVSARIAAGLLRLGLPHRVIPSLESILTAKAAPARTPEINPVELIGRTHYGLDRRAVARIVTGKRVLITGAGGSIGGELTRVVAGFAPESIILMERSENSLFTIDRQLGRSFSSIKRKAVLHDVVDEARTRAILEDERPHLVFHAAAHKHVPLMEDHPSAAIENNLFGTKSIADASVAAGVERFVMISSDKAVNPTSVMGATKRLAELYVSGLARATALTAPGGTLLSMVRFGNVLASACSVIPIWTEQLLSGGPITVTDPRMTRFFMTIPEAATLVVQAAALTARPGAAPVYVLDMGEPIRILDLAVRLTRLHGYEPQIQGEAHTDTSPDNYTPSTPMPIAFTGIRPGEKLHEELAYAAENLLPAGHPGINSWAAQSGASSDSRIPNPTELIAAFEPVRRAGEGGVLPERSRVLDLIRRWVPEMRAADMGATSA